MGISKTIPAQQARSQQTLQKILDAAENLLVDADYNDLSLQQIARTAGVTTGAIYARLENKAALLNALIDRYVQQSVHALEAFLADAEDANPEEISGLLIEAMICLFSTHQGVVRTALLVEPETVNSPYLQSVKNLYECARIELQKAATLMGNKDPKVASTFALTLMMSACREQIAVIRNGRFFEIGTDQFIRELTYTINRYLKK